MKSLFTCLLVIMAVGASADNYVETTSFMGATMKVWTSGTNQRTEAPNPLTGGTTIKIICVEKGVEWNVDPLKKIYDEKPIPLPYVKDQPSSNSNSSPQSPSTGLGNTGPAPSMEIKKLPETRTIAGFPATGYQLLIGGQDNGSIWVTPIAGVLEKVQKETQAYQDAYQRKLYSNFPTGEQKEITEGMMTLHGMMTGPFSGMLQGIKEMPQGYPLSMVAGPSGMPGGENQPMVLFEVQKIQTNPLDPSLFAAPAGYQKVDDIAAHQTQDMMKGMNPTDLEQMMKSLQKSMGPGGN